MEDKNQIKRLVEIATEIRFQSFKGLLFLSHYTGFDIPKTLALFNQEDLDGCPWQDLPIVNAIECDGFEEAYKGTQETLGKMKSLGIKAIPFYSKDYPIVWKQLLYMPQILFMNPRII
ncbi:hypothetical protein [Parasediminibacterium sp. JCM 36343]|uniref:hypothetical protein n=1 Tax=Parasediminibacterium sp. JCM 36343 TaxID=3374279 RepID=UPI00397E2F29